MPWKCPECEATIDTLDYTVPTCGTEYGTAYLSDNNEPSPTSRVDDYNYNDHSDTDWDGSCSYNCPECSSDIEPADLVWTEKEEEEEEEEEENTEPDQKKITEDETLHEIITPLNKITSKENPKDASSTSIICKKCFYLFVRSKEEAYSEEFCECPKCSEPNSTTEFQQLLREGYYSNKKHAHK